LKEKKKKKLSQKNQDEKVSILDEAEKDKKNKKEEMVDLMQQLLQSLIFGLNEICSKLSIYSETKMEKELKSFMDLNDFDIDMDSMVKMDDVDDDYVDDDDVIMHGCDVIDDDHAKNEGDDPFFNPGCIIKCLKKYEVKFRIDFKREENENGKMEKNGKNDKKDKNDKNDKNSKSEKKSDNAFRDGEVAKELAKSKAKTVQILVDFCVKNVKLLEKLKQ
jgi:hypothetical protein